MKTGKFEYNINEHESNIQKMNKLMLHLQKKHPFYQNNNFFIKNKLYAKNEWELKLIVSELTIKFLILHTTDVNDNEISEDLQFPDWYSVDLLCEDIGIYLDENHSLHDEYRGHKFDLDRESFIQIVNMIPYMMIEQNHACPCCNLFTNCYFTHFGVTIPIDYFTCNHATGYFVNNTELINHLSVQLHPKINDDVNRYHQIFYIWLSFYEYSSIKLKEVSSYISFNMNQDSSIKVKQKLRKWNICNACNRNFYSSSKLHNNIRCCPRRINLNRLLLLSNPSKLPTNESDIKEFEKVLETNYHSPKMVLSKPKMNYLFISCFSIKQIFRRTHEDNKDSLNIIPEDLVKSIIEYLIPSDDTMIQLSIRLFHFLRLKFQSKQINLFLIHERDEKFFRCSYILKRDDEMFIRYSAAQQTIEWIVDSNTFKVIVCDVVGLSSINGLSRQDSSFLYTKDDYIKIAKALPFMMSETLLICPCDAIFDNHFWDHFECCTPFQQDEKLKCFTPKKCHNCNFKSLDQLMEHVSKFKCNHHRIIAKYLQCYLNLKKNRSLLIHQMKDVTSDTMAYILNTPFHKDEFIFHLNSMFTIIDVKDDENSGFNSIINSLNSIMEKEVYEKPLALRQNMRDKLSNENIKKSFISSMKKSSQPIENCYSQELSDDSQVQSYQDTICPKDDFKSCRNNYIHKKFGFDGSYSLILLSLMFKDIWFYCYSEEKNDLNIYKFNHESNKSIITRSHIYTPVRYKCCVCILQKSNTKNFKSLIPKKKIENITVR